MANYNCGFSLHSIVGIHSLIPLAPGDKGNREIQINYYPLSCPVTPSQVCNGATSYNFSNAQKWCRIH